MTDKALTEEEQACVEKLIKELTLQEKCSLLSGGTFWYTQDVERLGIDGLMLTDGPHGLRKQDDKADHLGLNLSVPATCFPPAAALGASWNPELVYRMGEALGIECRAENVAVLLGPGTNIKRSPLCGRNFEYFSEDPYLSSHMAAAHIQGVQSKGVGTSIKHFAANNQETKRLTMNAVVDERALREIYLASFEYAIKEGDPWTVMCAYNKLNGCFGSENPYTLQQILRDEWGYEGLLVTDWGAVNDRVKGLIAGQDLEMPSSGGVNDEKVLQAVQSGELDEAYVDRAVYRLLALMKKARRKNAVEDFSPEKHHQLAAEIGGECIVLLKNENQVLPLKAGETIALIGEFAENPRMQGGGSSHTNPTFVSSVKEELENNPNLSVLYAQGFELKGTEPNTALEEAALEIAGRADKVVFSCGLPEMFETEGIDRTHLGLPYVQLALLEKLKNIGKPVIVMLSNGAPVTLPFVDWIDGLLECYLLGQAGGIAMARVLTGEVNPSGKLAETFPLRLEDTPSYLNFPGEGYQVEYKEGIFVGYRYYDTKELPVQYPFGFGLSYTSFSYDSIELDKKEMTDKETLYVRVQVTNQGSAAGKEIVQLYVQDLQKDIVRPVKELKGFQKLSLAPGESKIAVFKLDKRSFAYYDTAEGDFLVQSGDFRILAGASSQDIRLGASLKVYSTDVRHKVFSRGTTFGEVFHYPPTNAIAREIMDYFQRESGIDFGLGDNVDDFAFRVISDFPLKCMVTFTRGRFTEAELQELLSRLNKFGSEGWDQSKDRL